MQLYLKSLEIQDVRGLHDIVIPISTTEKKHLILTGRNGSGKTSVLRAIATHLNALATDRNFFNYLSIVSTGEQRLSNSGNMSQAKIYEQQAQVDNYREKLTRLRHGVDFELNVESDNMYASFQKNEYIIAFYEANRIFNAVQPKHIEKVTLKDTYSVNAHAREDFIKFIVDLKIMEALTRNNSEKLEKSEQIRQWFDKFESLLRTIFENESLKMEFDEETYRFTLNVDGKPPFDFNTLSSGYAAVMDIVVDIILRMQRRAQRAFMFDMAGIVLIDEIETHLHIDLQKNIMKILTDVFPNLQFIITTHSPFILNCLENVVIYDLEKELLVENSLTDVSYSGIIEGYFAASEMSNVIMRKFNLYRDLTQKETVTDDELLKIDRLQKVLDDIPDFLSLSIATEYQKLKLEFESRGDFAW